MTYKDFSEINDKQIIKDVKELGSISSALRRYGMSPKHTKARKRITSILSDYNVSYDLRKTDNKTYTIEELSSVFDSANCWSDVYRGLNLSICGYNKKWIIRFAEQNGVSVPIFTKEQLGQTYARGKNIPYDATEIFVENSSYHSVRKALVKFFPNIPQICASCGVGTEWNGNPLTLEVDHINGIHTDNRLENLRWLCPNCHSQTDTFRKKNVAP